MLTAWFSNEWGRIIPSVADGTRPSAAFGATITPGNNSYGSYVSLLAGSSLTDDCYGIAINFNSNNTSAQARDTIATIGLDPAGGSSFTDFILDLLCSSAGSFTGGNNAGTGGVWYWFPIFIKAGTSIGCKASINNGTVGTLRANLWCCCRPKRPELVRVGTFVDTLGSTPASSSGTAITPGTTSDGAWTQAGSNVSKGYFYLEWGWGDNTSTMTNNTNYVDIGVGDGTNNRVVAAGCRAHTDSAEAIGKPLMQGAFADIAPGDGLYLRAQTGPNAASTTASFAIYAVG